MNEILKAKYEVWMWRRIFKRFVIPTLLFLLLLCMSLIFILISNRRMNVEAVGPIDPIDDYEVESTQLIANDEAEYTAVTTQVEEPWPDRVAFLTFDDGPSWNTGQILDILYQEEVPAIFFLLGSSLTHFPDSKTLMERILAEGHYIGLHSMTHVSEILYEGAGAANRFVDEMLQLQGIIYDSVGHQTNLCRAPYGMMTGFRTDSGHAEAIAEAGITCIDWNVDPQDWRNNPELIMSYVTSQVEMMDFPSELVIVLHEKDETIAALPGIISFLREQGYVFKTYEPGHEFIYQQYRNRLH